MLKTAGFFLLWLTGSAAAVAVAWTGVSIVDDELIDPAPAFDQVVAGASGTVRLDQTNLSQAPTSSGATTVADLSATWTLDHAEATPAQPATDTSTTTVQPTTTPPANSTDTDTSSTTTRAPTTTSAPSPTIAPPAETLTFNLVGGSTAISFSAAGVDVLWATPNPGFTVRIAPESPGIKVEFEADDHESRIDAWWAGGPQHEIREKPDG